MPRISQFLSALRQNPPLALAFLAATTAALFFAVRLVVGLLHWDPAPEEEIRPWMTVGYIGRSWNLDPREIDALAGLPLPEDRASEPRPYTLAEIAEERGVPVEAVIATVEAAVAELRARPAAPPVPNASPPPAAPVAPPTPGAPP